MRCYLLTESAWPQTRSLTLNSAPSRISPAQPVAGLRPPHSFRSQDKDDNDNVCEECGKCTMLHNLDDGTTSTDSYAYAWVDATHQGRAMAVNNDVGNR